MYVVVLCGKNSSRVLGGARCKALALLPAEVLGQMGQDEEHWCHEQSRDQREESNEHGQKVLDPLLSWR